MISEEEGTAALKAAFEAAGYTIAENVMFEEGSVKFEADGWDAKARVGYEFMTLGERDHEDLDPDEMLQLQQWTEQGKLHFLFIDETDVEDLDALRDEAQQFLDAVAKRKAQQR